MAFIAFLTHRYLGGTDTLQNGTNAIVSGGTSQIQSSSGQSTHRRVMAAIREYTISISKDMNTENSHMP